MESAGQLDGYRLKISQLENQNRNLSAQLERYQTYDHILPQLKEEAARAKQMDQTVRPVKGNDSCRSFQVRTKLTVI
jgi:cell shape-determining protein MreC